MIEENIVILNNKITLIFFLLSEILLIQFNDYFSITRNVFSSHKVRTKKPPHLLQPPYYFLALHKITKKIQHLWEQKKNSIVQTNFSTKENKGINSNVFVLFLLYYIKLDRDWGIKKALSEGRERKPILLSNKKHGIWIQKTLILC